MASLHVASELVKAITNIIYPVGSIYISTNTANPASYLGGTWQQVAHDCYLIGYNAGNTWFDKPGQNKGSKNGPGNWNTDNHTLTINEIPSHNHEIDIGSFANGAEDWNSIKNGHIAPQNNQGTRFTTRTRGGGKGHNHFHVLPYYIVVVWKRTA